MLPATNTDTYYADKQDPFIVISKVMLAISRGYNVDKILSFSYANLEKEAKAIGFSFDDLLLAREGARRLKSLPPDDHKAMALAITRLSKLK